MDAKIKIAEQAAVAAGEILLKMKGKIEAREKAPADLVTEADLLSQQKIFEILRQNFPDHGLLGEESSPERNQEQDQEYCWIVDPLDGTTNYVHGLDNFCVSIGLRRAGKMVGGVVFDPVRKEMFTAIRGNGAFLNGHPIRVSSTERVSEALLAASISAKVTRDSPEVLRFIEVLCQCQALRRMGSAALNLCYVAAGRLDGYWATSVKIWDVAAGVLIVEEAGGSVCALDGGCFDLERPRLLTTGTIVLQAELLEMLRRVETTG